MLFQAFQARDQLMMVELNQIYVRQEIIYFLLKMHKMTVKHVAQKYLVGHPWPVLVQLVQLCLLVSTFKRGSTHMG